MMDSFKNHPSNGVYWDHDKNHLSAHKKVDGKVRELYHISKDRCQTKDQQMDWVNQISGKVWGDTYRFIEALRRACQDWGTW